MTTKNTKTIDRTIAGLTEQVIKEFAFYGFKVAKPAAEVQQWRGRGGNTGSIEIEFAKERATGQAAFSQDEVTCRAVIYLGEKFVEMGGKLNPWEVWKLDTLQWLSPEEQEAVKLHGHNVRLDVNYPHHNGGTNGVSREYLFKDGLLKLAPRR